MAISSAVCNSFKQEILVGTHNFTASSGNTFKIALFTSDASLGAGTTAYSTSFTANGALIYNDTQSDKAVAVIAFGGDKTVSSGTFTIQFPTADASNAIIRIA